MDTLNTTAYDKALKEWTKLLTNNANGAFLDTHFHTIFELAVQLYILNLDANVDHLIQTFTTQEEEQLALSFAFVFQQLLETIIRAHMKYLCIVNPSTVSITPLKTLENEENILSASYQSTLEDQKAQVLKIPQAFRSRFQEALHQSWSILIKGSNTGNVSFSKYQDMKWRVVSRHTVLLHIKCTTGSRTIQVPVSQFHDLRYQTAKVLQHMNQIESHAILRLARSEKSLE